MVLLGSLVGTCLAAVGGMCGYLQGCEAPAFRAEAEKNYLRSLRLDTLRGAVYDRNHEALATSVEVDTVYANPRRVTDPIGAATALAPVLGMDEGTLLRRLTLDRHFVYIKRQVTAVEARQVEHLDLAGVMLLPEAKRFYPKKELAGQLLGIVGVDSRGREGLELTFDALLRGGQLVARYQRDSTGRSAMFQGLPPVETRAGHSLRLTLDEKVQAIAEQELERAVIRALAKSGIAVVIDVPSGDLLAVAHYPRFNPNRYREQIRENRIVVNNRAITDVFEPGSTFKIFTLAAALEESLVTLDDVLDTENGRYRVGRHTVTDTHPKARMTVREALKFSSNIGMAKLAQALGRERFHEYLRAFGFGETTGLGLVGEVPGLLRPPREWAEITLANIAFGQGVAVTAVQLCNALAAIGRGGLFMHPRVVLTEYDSDGNVLHDFEPVSVTTAKQVIDAMKSVLDHDGTGHQAWIYDYDVAGKTGTAQKADTIAGGYSEDKWVASFLGLVPARRPRLAILVVVDEPDGRQTAGGVIAAPAFREIAERTLHHLNVPPSFGSRVRVDSRARVSTLRSPGLVGPPQPRVAGQPGAPDGGAADAEPPAPAAPTAPDGPGDPAPVERVDPLDPLSVVVPSFTGLSPKDAARLAYRHHLLIDVSGSGVAERQSVPAGTPLDPWSRVTVHFEPAAGPSPGPAPTEEGGQ